jgi:autotransporter translocation and assembly factor TamB
MRKAWRVTNLIVALPMLALALGSYLYLAKVSRECAARLPGILSKAASERIDGDIAIGKAAFSPSGILLSDIVVSEKGNRGKTVVRIPSIMIACRIADLLKGADPTRSIKTIEVLKPTVFLERASNGRWNVLQLLKPPKPGRALKYAGQVRVQSARVVVRDLKPNPAKPMDNRLSDVSALVDFSKPSAAKFSIWGKGQPKRFGRFLVRGDYYLVTHAYSAEIQIADGNARYFSTYPWRIGVDVLSGKADAGIRLSKTAKEKPIKYAALIKVRDASIGFHQIRRPVQNVSGDVYIQDGTASMKLDGNLGSSPLSVSGDILDFKRPRLALELNSRKADFIEVARITGYAEQLRRVKLPGHGIVRGYVYGPPGSLAVDFDVRVPSVSSGGIVGRDVFVRGTYANRRISIRQAFAQTCGGRVYAGGLVVLSDSPSAELSGRVAHLKLDQIPTLREHGLRITSTGGFSASIGSGHSSARYQGSISDIKYGGLRFENGSLDLAYSDGEVSIRELSARTLDGLIAFSGKMSRKGQLNLDASGADINLAKVRDMYWKSPTVGRAYFTGQITGTLESPVFAGEVGAYRVMVAGVRAERIAGNITAGRSKIVLDNLVLYDYPGTLAISGSVASPLAETPTLNLTAKAESLDVGGAAGYFGDSFALEGGRLSGELTLMGTMANPTADGSLRIEGGTYRDMPVDALETRIAYKAGSLTIRDLSVRSGDSSISASGELSADDKIAVKFESKHLTLSTISGLFRPYASIAGDAVLTGSIAGTTGDPRVDVLLVCDNPAMNAQKFKHLSAKASFEGDTFSLSDLTLSDARGQYVIPSFSYNSASKVMEFTARIQDGQADKVLALFDRSPALGKTEGSLAGLPSPFTGVVNGEVSGRVQFTDQGAVPDLQAELNVTDMKLGLDTFQALSVKGYWQKDSARLEKIEAVSGDMKISGQGSLGPADVLVLQLKGESLDVGTICRWLDIPQNFSGKADVTIVASGTSRAPSSDIVVKIADPVIKGTKFDRLESHLSLREGPFAPSQGEQAWAGSRINISDLTLTVGNRNLRLSGYLPLDRRSLTVPKDGPLLLQAILDGESLAILSKLTGIAAETGASGAFDGSVKLTGTVESPKLEGTLAWSDGRVQIPRLNSPLDKISAKMSLAGDTITIEQLTGSSTEGGRFDIAGKVSLADLKPELDLQIKTSGLGISGRNFTNLYGEDVRVKLDGKASITEGWRTPLISGNVEIPDGSVALPSKPAKKGKPIEMRGFDPRFDIEASLGRNVRFGAARLKNPMYGNLSVGGSLSSPIVEGTLDVSGGTIIFPMSRMKLTPGSMISLRTSPSKQIDVLVDVRAQTRMPAVSQFGQRRRYTVTMVAQGPLDHLDPQFESSPPDLTEQQIVGLLAGEGELERMFAQGGPANLAEVFSTALMPSVFAPIEEAFENTLGLEEFALEMGYRQPLMLTIGQRLVDGLYLDYSAALGARADYADSAYELKLSYRFKRGIELGITTDQNRTATIGVEGKLRF